MIRNRDQLLDTLKDLFSHIKDEFKVSSLGVFGSFSSDEMNPDSDIDIIVEFQPDQKTFTNFMKLKLFLEEKLGRDVDLVTEKALHPKLKSRILESVIYT